MTNITAWAVGDYPGTWPDDVTARVNEPTWTSYAISWTSSGTAPVLSDGTLVARWRPILTGWKLAIVELRLVFGASTTQGTGQWFFSLPAAATANSATMSSGGCFFLNSGVQDYSGSVKMEDTTKFRCMQAAGSVGAGSPFAWGVADELRAQLIYEQA